MVLDVKTGSGAFMKDEQDALKLCRTMVAIGEKSGRPTIGLITSMDQPLGRAVGNSLEMIESFEALKGRGPQDIMEVSTALGYGAFKAAGMPLTYPQTMDLFAEAIASGRALDVLRRFISAQGGDARVCDDYSLLPACRHTVDLKASASGYISAIDSFAVGMAAIDTGAGRRRKEDAVEYGGGFIFHAKVGDPVEKGQKIVTVHSDRSELVPSVLDRLNQAIRIVPGPVTPPKMVLHLVDKDGVTPWLV
jgi:pyrimidine-nucleoside phosphorylase